MHKTGTNSMHVLSYTHLDLLIVSVFINMGNNLLVLL